MEINPMPLIMSVPRALQEAPIRSWTWMICDESAILEQIEMTHYPDGRHINVHSLLGFIHNILKDCHTNNPSLEDSEGNEEEYVDEVVQHEIQRLSPELAYLGSGVIGDVHAKTVDVFNKLPNYPWEAKLALALAALVTNYAEYWVVAQANPEDNLTKSMKFLRQIGEAPPEQQHLEVLHGLIESMLDMIQGIIKIKDFMVLSADETTISIATILIVIGSYWTVRSIVTCAPYIHSLFTRGYEPSASKKRELGIMTGKIRALLECLRDHQENNSCSSEKVKHAVEMEKKYRVMQRAFEEDHVDNFWILNMLFNSKGDDLTPIFDCSRNRKVKLESFKNNYVVLMISSGIDIPEEMLHNLARIWKNKKDDGDAKHEMIWFPITQQPVEWTETMQHKFEELCSKMPFYSVYDPRSIDPTVIKIVKEKFYFKKETILVVMDGVGKIVHHNAVHMLWSWGKDAFPLTVKSEMDMWGKLCLGIESEDWGLKLEDLVSGIDEMTEEWVKKKKLVFLIGGDDMELIKRLCSERAHAFISYIGSSSTGRREKDRKKTWEITDKDKKERLHCWEDDEEYHSKVWLFWTRVESMLLSRIHFLRNNNNSSSSVVKDEDEIAKDLKKLLSYHKNCHTWAILNLDKSLGIEDGSIMLKAFPDVDQFDNSKKVILHQFDNSKKAMQDYCKKIRAATPSHKYRCSRLEFPTETAPESLNCEECNCAMQKYTALLCSHHNQQQPSSS